MHEKQPRKVFPTTQGVNSFNTNLISNDDLRHQTRIFSKHLGYHSLLKLHTSF